MKKIAFFILAIFTIVSVSCCAPPKTVDPEKTVSDKTSVREYKVGNFGMYEVVEIEGCEYVVYDGFEAGGITHKGNCKYCEQKRKEQLRYQ